MEAWGNSSGQPLGLDFDSQGVAFVCDAAHQAIFRIVRVGTSVVLNLKLIFLDMDPL